MGYTTDFSGTIKIEPPLNKAEILYLEAFNGSRRVKRTKGPYFVGDTDTGVFRPGGKITQHDDVIDSNCPPDGQPGLWCHWMPSPEGDEIEWDGGEKFYDSEEWMRYIIDHFLKPDCAARIALPFLQANHICNGEIEAQGEDSSDSWLLIVKDNVVSSERLVKVRESKLKSLIEDL